MKNVHIVLSAAAPVAARGHLESDDNAGHARGGAHHNRLAESGKEPFVSLKRAAK